MRIIGQSRRSTSCVPMLSGLMSKAASHRHQTARSRCGAGRPQRSEVFRQAVASGTWDTVTSIEMPVAVVAGRPEDIGPGAFASTIAGALPAGTLIVRPDLGHFGPLEDPVAMAADVAGWVRAHTFRHLAKNRSIPMSRERRSSTSEWTPDVARGRTGTRTPPDSRTLFGGGSSAARPSGTVNRRSPHCDPSSHADSIAPTISGSAENGEVEPAIGRIVPAAIILNRSSWRRTPSACDGKFNPVAR